MTQGFSVLMSTSLYNEHLMVPQWVRAVFPETYAMRLPVPDPADPGFYGREACFNIDQHLIEPA